MKTKATGTKARIVEEARRLFNEQGYGQVTTAALAAHLGIAEGNLWYHFKTRAALLDALSERYAAGVEARLALTPGTDPVSSYVALLQAMMAEFRGFRFLYRDQQAYGEHSPLIRTNAPRWIERTYGQIENHLAALVDSGLLDWPRERLRDLAINATIILRYGLEHVREAGGVTGAGSGAVRAVLKRHLTLFEHRLDPDTAARIHAAIERIDADNALVV